MKRIFAAAALALATGCRGPSQVYDPFLGRTTVDPPGTASPPPGQPYYGAPPVTAPPATIAPGAAATPVPRVWLAEFRAHSGRRIGIVVELHAQRFAHSARFDAAGKSRHVADYTGFQFRPARLSAAGRHRPPSAILPRHWLANVGPSRLHCNRAEQSTGGVGCRPNPRGTRHIGFDKCDNRRCDRIDYRRFEPDHAIEQRDSRGLLVTGKHDSDCRTCVKPRDP